MIGILWPPLAAGPGQLVTDLAALGMIVVLIMPVFFVARGVVRAMIKTLKP